jgi:hypothetical protein
MKMKAMTIGVQNYGCIHSEMDIGALAEVFNLKK